MKPQHILIIGMIALLLYSSAQIIYTPKSAKDSQDIMPPTVFLHGYKGTYYSFGNLLNRFQNKYRWGDKGLVYRVGVDGTLNVQEQVKGKSKPLFIQVIFENNRASFQEGSAWLAAVMQDLKEKYFIQEVNLVGHSMGGLMSVKYILDYEGTLYPEVHKLVTIGSPFDGIYNESYFLNIPGEDAAAHDLRPDSEGLKSLHDREFPKTIQVLSIYSTGDPVARPKSVEALRTIVPNSQLHEQLIDDEKLGHSMLHESSRVDHFIHDFLNSEPKESKTMNGK